MDLYVLRHGLADDRNTRKYPDDRKRPLTPKGFKRLKRQAKGMNSIGLSAEVIATSPLLRAVQTAEVVQERLADSGILSITDNLAPWADPREVLDELREDYASARNVMVVGHEPHLSSLISLVATGSLDAGIRLKKGALCKLRIPRLSSGRCGRIEWSLTPKQMIMLG